MSVKTAVIGLGIMGRRMTEHMALHPGFAPVALWDPDPTACRAAHAFAPDAQITKTPEEAIAAADLVYLACPPVPRKAYALAAADAGRSLFLEKPLGVDIAESTALVAHLEERDVPVAVNFTQAAGAALTSVHAAARAGTMGDRPISRRLPPTRTLSSQDRALLLVTCTSSPATPPTAWTPLGSRLTSNDESSFARFGMTTHHTTRPKMYNYALPYATE